jgi:hypothetical protein
MLFEKRLIRRGCGVGFLARLGNLPTRADQRRPDAWPAPDVRDAGCTANCCSNALGRGGQRYSSEFGLGRFTHTPGRPAFRSA